MTRTKTTPNRSVRTDMVLLTRRQDLARLVRHHPPGAPAPTEFALAIPDQRLRLDGFLMCAFEAHF